MEARGSRRTRPLALAASIIIIAAGIAVAVALALKSHPSTDDAALDAEIVHVAASVGGRIINLPVKENMQVHKGDLLFQIDPLPYQQLVNQAAANLDLARATLANQQRHVSTQRSAAAIAGEQARRAQTNYGFTERSEGRPRPLPEKGYVPVQQLDQAQVALRDAQNSLRQAQEQARAAERAIDDQAGAEAAVRASIAALAVAQRTLDDTTVRAPHDG